MMVIFFTKCKKKIINFLKNVQLAFHQDKDLIICKPMSGYPEKMSTKGCSSMDCETTLCNNIAL